MNMLSIPIVILTWNSAKTLSARLKSIREQDNYIDKYLPVTESIQKHHACKECGLINYRSQNNQLKTGALIVLIKELFEKSGIVRGRIRIYVDRIKQMKREGIKDDDIIEAIMIEESGDCKAV